MHGYCYAGYGYYGYYGFATRANYAYNYYLPSTTIQQTFKQDDLYFLIDFDSQNYRPYEVEDTYSLAYGSSDYFTTSPYAYQYAVET